MRYVAVLLVLCVGVSLAAEKKDAGKAPSIEGTWLITSIETGGMKIEGDTLKDMPLTVVIKDGKWKITGASVDIAGTLKVDFKKKPAEIDTTETEGPNKGRMLKGIIELKGDTMRVCASGMERPKEISTKDQPEYTLIEYQRVKK